MFKKKIRQPSLSKARDRKHFEEITFSFLGFVGRPSRTVQAQGSLVDSRQGPQSRTLRWGRVSSADPREQFRPKAVWLTLDKDLKVVHYVGDESQAEEISRQT